VAPRERIAYPGGPPILLIAGTDDPVGDKTTTIRDLINRYMKQGQLALEYRFYADGRHEILNETGKDSVHRDIAHWLTQILDRRADAGPAQST